MRRLPFFILSLLLLLLSYSPASADVSSDVFSNYSERVTQVRVIEKVSGGKAGIGSGFYVSDTGLLVTNYHVISAAVVDPDKYRVDLLLQDGSTRNAELLYLDVVRDLALLQAPKNDSGYFDVSAVPPSKGAKIYSFGNPRDLGFTIVEGTYNGTIRESRLEKFNFSGSLNPGMSGGPVVSSTGQVIGVNVSTAGNQLSFLVPAKYVLAMLVKYNELLSLESQSDSDVSTEWRFTLSNKGFLKLVEQQILNDQHEKFSKILSAPLSTVSLGELSVPSRLFPSLKCWSSAKDRKDEGFTYLSHNCSTNELLYVNSEQKVGNVYLFYLLLRNENLNQFSFASTVERFLSTYNKGGGATKEQVTNYSCKKDFVDIKGSNYWVNVCMRRYKKMPHLYDLNIVGSSVDSSEKALLLFGNFSGISFRNAKLMVQAYLEGIEWTP